MHEMNILICADGYFKATMYIYKEDEMLAY